MIPDMSELIDLEPSSGRLFLLSSFQEDNNISSLVSRVIVVVVVVLMDK